MVPVLIVIIQSPSHKCFLQVKPALKDTSLNLLTTRLGQVLEGSLNNQRANTQPLGREQQALQWVCSSHTLRPNSQPGTLRYPAALQQTWHLTFPTAIKMETLISAL